MGGTVSFSKSDESNLSVNMTSSSLQFFCKYLEECMASNPVLKNDAQFADALSWPLRTKDGYLGLRDIQTTSLKELARLFHELADGNHYYWKDRHKCYPDSTIKSWQRQGVNVEEWIVHVNTQRRIKAAELAAATEQRLSFLQSRS